MDLEDKDDSVRGAIESAFKEAQETAQTPEGVEKTVDVENREETTRSRDESGKFKPKEEPVTTEAKQSPVKAKVNAPESWGSSVKSKWEILDPDVQAEIAKREADMHKMMTSPDGELQLGRKMKETIAPYMAIIQSEGGEPVSAVKDLLNTAYILRTAPPLQKAQLVQQVIQQYGIDMSLVGNNQGQERQPDVLMQMYNELQSIKQSVNPETLQKQLQERMEADTIMRKIQDFRNDPANVHYAKVEDYMISIAPSIRAKNPAASPEEILKLSYQAACRADPDIYSTLEAEKQAAEVAKKSQEVAAKKRAASSLTGSPGVTVPNTGAPERSLREEIAANLRQFSS